MWCSGPSGPRCWPLEAESGLFCVDLCPFEVLLRRSWVPTRPYAAALCRFVSRVCGLLCRKSCDIFEGPLNDIDLVKDSVVSLIDSGIRHWKCNIAHGNGKLRYNAFPLETLFLQEL